MCTYVIDASIFRPHGRGVLQRNDTIVGEWRLFKSGWIMGHLLRLAPVPSGQIGRRGSRLFARVHVGVSVRGGCWHWQICSWIKALCRTKRCHNAPCHCIHDLIYRSADATPSRDCNNSVDSPLRIQPYSRGTSVSREERQISSNRPLRILQLVSSFKARGSFELESSWFHEDVALSNVSATAPNTRSLTYSRH